MYELNKHKRKDSIKWTITFIAIVLLAIMVVGLCLQLFAGDKYKPSEWFKKPDTEQTLPDETANGGMLVNPIYASTDIQLRSAPIKKSASNTDEVSSQAESYDTFTVVATVSAADDSIKTTSWAVLFVDGNSTWAQGKTVTDYVTVTASGDYNNTATVTCKQPFGEQIKLVCTVNYDKTKTAECVLDFVKRVESVTTKLNDNDYLKFGESNTFTYTFNYGVGTITGEVSDVSFEAVMNSTLVSTLNYKLYEKGLGGVVVYKSITLTSNFTLSPGDMDAIFIDNQYGSVTGARYPDIFPTYDAWLSASGKNAYSAGYDILATYTYSYDGKIISSAKAERVHGVYYSANGYSPMSVSNVTLSENTLAF